MNSRDRVLATLDHQEPDRVPVSLGGTAHKLTDSRTLRLMEHFGLDGNPPAVLSGPIFSYYDHRLFDKLGTDIRHIFLRPPHGFRSVQAEDGGYLDEWGISFHQGQMMYKLAGQPLVSATIEDIENYRGPDPTRPELVDGLRSEAKYLYETSECAVAAYRPLYSGVFEMSYALMGMENLMVNMLTEADLIEALFKRLTDIQINFYNVLLDAAGDYLHIVEYADDLGAQNSPLISPDLYRQLLKPCHAKIVEAIKAKAPHVKVMLHSCGAVRPFIPDFIEVGFDILNPIQTAAREMIPAELKAEFGNNITFLGGIDVQHKMRGSIEVVEEEVRAVIGDMRKGGGYILAPSHNFGDDVPIENILAFFNTAREYGTY